MSTDWILPEKGTPGAKYKSYSVTWQIDVDADNPTDAAKQAYALMHAPGSTANVFSVWDSDGEETVVDLEEINQEAGE